MSTTRKICALLVLSAALTWTTAATAQEATGDKVRTLIKVEYALDGDALITTNPGKKPVTTALGCAATSLLQHHQSLYVTCGFDGVLIFDLTDPAAPRRVGQRDFGGDVTGLFLQGNRVWAQIARTEAQPLSKPGGEPALTDRDRVVTAELPAPEPETTEPTEVVPPPAELTPAMGAVVEVGVGQVVVDFGAEAGIKKGDRVELYVEQNENLGGGQSAIREDLIAVAEAFAVSDQRSKLKLGINESVEVGTLARATKKKLTGSMVKPPRVAGIYETQFMARPFLALGDFGFGMVSDASFGYRAERPIHVFVLLEPAGIGLADEGNIVAMAGNVVVAYDTQMFEVGLGLGWSAINDAVEDSVLSADATGGDIDPKRFERVRSGFSIAQAVRLGSRDGFHLRVYNTFLVYQDQFNYGGTTGSLQVPVSEKSWLIAQGGGGVAGYAYGELGLRVLVHGNGGQGSIFITPSVGGAGLFGEKDSTCTSYDYSVTPPTPVEVDCAESIGYGGPMVGFGMEFRH